MRIQFESPFTLNTGLFPGEQPRGRSIRDFGVAYMVSNDLGGGGLGSIRKPPALQTIENIPEANAVVVRFVPDAKLDENSTTEKKMDSFILEKASLFKATKIVVDFSDIDYLSSGGMGNFITLNRNAKNAGINLILCNVPDRVKETLEITKLNKLFKTSENVDTALAQ